MFSEKDRGFFRSFWPNERSQPTALLGMYSLIKPQPPMDSRTNHGLKQSTAFGVRLCATLITLIGTLFFGGSEQGFTSPNLEQPTAVISTPSGSTIYAEIAATPDKRAQGLMFRKSLGSNRGMLFIFPEKGYYAFWMKNTLIPLDIMWLDESGMILHLERDVPICTKTDDSCPRYFSTRESLYVLEIQGGTAKKYGLEPGKPLKLSIPKSHPAP